MRALVTGGGRGLGQAMAVALAQAGAAVALTSRTVSELDDTVNMIGGSAQAVPADLSDRKQVEKIVDESEARLGGGIDIVLHAAGVTHRQPAEEFDAEQWDRVLEINLTAPFRLSQAVARRQIQSAKEGSHLFIGSLASRLSVPFATAYTASKSGIYGVVRNLGAEWGPHGIRVNGIGPGYFRTKLTEAVFNDEKRVSAMTPRIPLGRFGAAEDLAGAAVFLSSPAASYITGQMLMVDGGWCAT
ncbi:SDR family NAD(P)-dependent oxidoreductase [Nesterenkonia ebinurensis]|uniref:SDR family NAD(P)-dependent oxidoreductase n=1 Tax=Nesterenkonia ebinurensis TaxID=2608252 RepID=UPI00123E148F|nr:SDR family oxidoreductase [Nesterenkonia ebinurensis]